MIKNSFAAAFVLIGVLLAGEPLFAQNGATQTAQPVAERERAPSVDEQIAMLRTDLRSTRKQVVAANMKLTDAEAEKFWPIYDQYIKELVEINNGEVRSHQRVSAKHEHDR